MSEILSASAGGDALEWIDGWKALSELLCPVGVGFWAALCQNQGGMLLQVRYPLCLWECLWMDGSTGIYDENLLYLDLAWY